jgi:ectoine hydroxylase-related dioxygenase (phytanoyl-CoA dioxygenase family)
MNAAVQPLLERDPQRLPIPIPTWTALSPEQREHWFAQADREIDEVGIVVVREALSADECDEFIAIIEEEIRTASYIERVMHGRRTSGTGYGYKIYDFQSRHPLALQLIAFPFVLDYFRRCLGQDMVLHSSEGSVVTPGAGGGGLHYDGYDRIKDYYLSMNSIFYLCDTNVTNGATRYVPGTHKEFISNREAREREVKYIEAEKGDLVIFNPYLIHSGSPNMSDSPRPVIINYYQRGYIKQGFDYARAMSVPQIKRLTPDQRTLLGLDHQVPQDIRELYKFRPELVGMDPLGNADRDTV